MYCTVGLLFFLCYGINMVKGETFLLAPLGDLTNGSTETTAYIDETPAGEWGAYGGTTDPVDTTATDQYKVGAASLKAVWQEAAVAGDGIKRTVTGDDLEANESIGFWIRHNWAGGIAAGDLQLGLLDDAPAQRTFDIPAVAVDTWTWVEVDIDALAAGTGDVITEVQVVLSSQGATNLGAFSLWLDGMMKWDEDDEVDLGADIVDGGVKTVLTELKATSGVHTRAAIAEWTDYFINYQTGDDVLVVITDQSAECSFALVGY
jgi:hypothetical protein